MKIYDLSYSLSSRVQRRLPTRKREIHARRRPFSGGGIEMESAADLRRTLFHSDQTIMPGVSAVAVAGIKPRAIITYRQPQFAPGLP